jgi:hypothetical protein
VRRARTLGALLVAAAAAAGGMSLATGEDGGEQGGGAGLERCSSVRYPSPSGAGDITFALDRSYTCGRFANGDWFVVPERPGDAVTITGIAPEAAGGRNGMWSNPEAPDFDSSQPWDDRIESYEPSEIAFPYAARAGESIVKVVSQDPPSDYSFIRFAAVLTVLGNGPEDPGATFRPPYAGTSKPLLSTEDLELGGLGKLDAGCCPSRIGADEAVARTAHLRLNYSPDPVHGYFIVPGEAVAEGRTWGGDVYKGDVEVLGWLQLSGDAGVRRRVAVGYVQQGIDTWGAAAVSAGWYRGGGGNGAGALVPWVFAAAVLPGEALRTDLAAIDADRFWETSSFYRGKGGVALWGQIPCCEPHEPTYWNELGTESGNKTIRDPYGSIDGGGVPGTSYQRNTSAQVQATALMMMLMPEFKAQWPDVDDNEQVIYDYGRRWAETGVWTRPDRCAPKVGAYGADHGPDGSGGCIRGSGRAPQLHGTDANGGDRDSAFLDELWAAATADDRR